MKTYLILAVLISALTAAFAGCGGRPTTGTPVEFANACTPENEKKYIETSGFLDSGGGVFCSNRGGRMECSFNLRENPNGDKKISAYIEQGASANMVEELKSGFKREDIKIRDNAGNVINLAEKVRLVGEMNVTPDAKVCFLNVTKIER
ncbi:MAG: hypothetical protein M3384_21095 [Acidobacteriota bacterium]|nr:hypothetical protein [Acidobacteriota bacterium]